MRRGRRTGTGSKDFHAQSHSWYAYSWSAVPKHEILKSSEMLCRVSADISKDRCSSNLRSKQLMKCLQLLSPRKWKHCAYPPDLSMTVDQSKCLNGRETWIYSSTARQYVKFHHQERCEISKPVYYLFIALRSRPPATKTQSDCVHSTKRLFSLLLLLLPHTQTQLLPWGASVFVWLHSGDLDVHKVPRGAICKRYSQSCTRAVPSDQIHYYIHSSSVTDLVC